MTRFLKLNKKKIIMIIIFSFLVFLCSIFPYTGDDWAWGSSVGLDRLNTFFKDYNGRYAGNLIVLLLTRSVLLRVVVMSATIFGILYLSYKLVNKDNFTLFLLATLLIVTLPRLLLRQSIVWTSGFTNYAIPTVLILIYFYFINKEITNKKLNLLLNIFFIILGFCTALFVEHITIYIVAITFIIMICELIKNKKIPSKYIFYFIGAVTGTILMFSNGAYTASVLEQDTYRDIPTNGISSVFEKISENFVTIYEELILNNTILNIILVGVLLVLIYKFLKENKINTFKKHILNCSIFTIVGYVLYMMMKLVYPKWTILLKYTTYFEVAISALFFFTIALIVFICIEKKQVKQRILFYLLSIIILTLPLFVVQPIGSRCFFTAYCMFILIILELYNYCIDKDNLILNKIIAIGIIIYAIYLTSIYLYIFKVDQERISYMLKQNERGAKIIEVVNLPYIDYVWTSTPVKGSILEERIKIFYNIPQEVEIRNISLENWNKIEK